MHRPRDVRPLGFFHSFDEESTGLSTSNQCSLEAEEHVLPLEPDGQKEKGFQLAKEVKRLEELLDRDSFFNQTEMQDLLVSHGTFDVFHAMGKTMGELNSIVKQGKSFETWFRQALKGFRDYMMQCEWNPKYPNQNRLDNLIVPIQQLDSNRLLFESGWQFSYFADMNKANVIGVT